MYDHGWGGGMRGVAYVWDGCGRWTQSIWRGVAYVKWAGINYVNMRVGMAWHEKKYVWGCGIFPHFFQKPVNQVSKDYGIFRLLV